MCVGLRVGAVNGCECEFSVRRGAALMDEIWGILVHCEMCWGIFFVRHDGRTRSSLTEVANMLQVVVSQYKIVQLLQVPHRARYR
ncbi:hypothetical protein J6590_065026 [Homalodisca vitripennis]|nr:hypothetical protein J6590_065026 [Homalodisca vitripennis]